MLPYLYLVWHWYCRLHYSDIYDEHGSEIRFSVCHDPHFPVR